MKKIFCVVLTLCLLCAMTTAVFADIWIPEEEPAPTPEKFGFWGGIIIAAVLLVLLSVALYFFYRKRKE